MSSFSVDKDGPVKMDNSHDRHKFSLFKEHSEISLTYVWSRSAVNCRKYSLAKFLYFVFFGSKIVTICSRITIIVKICKLCKGIFLTRFSISPLNCAIFWAACPSAQMITDMMLILHL